MFNEYNKKITYYKAGELDIKRTARAHTKFYAKLMVDNLIRNYHEKLSKEVEQS